MNILFWQEVHPTVTGGADSWVRDTGRALSMRGHAVSWLQDERIEQACFQFKPDAVVLGTIHNFIGLHHAERLLGLGIPAVWMLHDYWPFCGPRMLMRDWNASDRGCPAVEGVCDNSCSGKASGRLALVNQFYVVVECEGTADIMRRNGVNVRAVIETGVDTDLWRPSEKRIERVVYCHAAGPEVWKGVHVLRAALDGTGIDVRFLTGMAREDVARELAGAAVYVFPSVYQETWGLALTEAMACGCACVASDVAGARAQIHPSSGIVVQPNEPGAILCAVETLLEDAKLSAEIGAIARAHVEAEHSLAAIGQRWERLLTQLAPGGGK